MKYGSDYQNAHHCAPSYTAALFDAVRRQKVIDWLVAKLKEVGAQAVAASGHSGLIPASIVAHKLGLPLLAVRQLGTDTHDVSMVNGIVPHHVRSFVIIDDGIASGRTVARIIEKVRAEFGAHMELTHILCWCAVFGGSRLTPVITGLAPDVVLHANPEGV